MKSVALIHTVKPLLNTFDKMLKEAVDEEIKVHNLFDDFLANNPNEIGEFTIDNSNRLFNHIKSAEMTGADLIVVTCSTLTPVVVNIRPFIKIPIIAIDDAMCKKAVSIGKNILILATARSTQTPLISKLTEDAKKINKEINVDFIANDEAFKAMKLLDMQKHDKILLDIAKEIRGYDCIVLAQASMAHLDNDIEEICKIPVFSSVKLCLDEVKNIILNL